MVKRYLVNLFVVVCALGGFILQGCDNPPEPTEPVYAGKIRFINFQQDVCTSGDATNSFDIFMYPVDGAVDTLPKAHALGYGISTVYLTNIPAGGAEGKQYRLIARPSGSKTTNLIETIVTIKPGDKLSWIIYSYNDGTKQYENEIISDNPTGTVSSSLAYFRFINTYKSDTVPNVIVRINDPLNTNNQLTPSPLGYRAHTDYIGYGTKVDSSLTFYVLDGNDPTKILGRISGVSLVPGAFNTITWAGSCKLKDVAEPVAVRDDSLRVRIFDDNENGNDQTNPYPQTMRYFFVNALIPPNFPRENLPTYEQIGVVINNDSKFNINGLRPFSVGPYETVGSEGNGVKWVSSISTSLTDAVNVKGYITDPASPDVRGKLLFDYRVGKRADIVTDQLVALVVSDSIRTSPLDSAKLQVAVPISDIPVPGKARIFFVNALSNPYRKVVSQSNIKFYVNGNEVSRPGSWSPRGYDIDEDPYEAGVNMELRAEMPNTSPVESVSANFTPSPGGIYLVLVAGQLYHTNDTYRPRIMIVRVNPPLQ